jgi:hypothetical protein
MSRQIKFTYHTEPHERFDTGAFDARIGDPWPIRLPSGRCVPAHLVAAKVAEDGRSVRFTVEIEDDEDEELILLGDPLFGLSFSFRDPAFEIHPDYSIDPLTAHTGDILTSRRDEAARRLLDADHPRREEGPHP